MLSRWVANSIWAIRCQLQKEFCEAWQVAQEDTRHPLCPPSAPHALANKIIKHKVGPDTMMTCCALNLDQPLAMPPALSPSSMSYACVIPVVLGVLALSLDVSDLHK